MKLDPYLSPHIKINSKWTKDLNIRAKTIKLWEENVGENLCYIGFDNDFLQQQNHSQREKIDGLDFIKIKNFSASKDTIKNEKATHRMINNICKLYTW